jgi:hypothetical protein
MRSDAASPWIRATKSSSPRNTCQRKPRAHNGAFSPSDTSAVLRDALAIPVLRKNTRRVLLRLDAPAPTHQLAVAEVALTCVAQHRLASRSPSHDDTFPVVPSTPHHGRHVRHSRRSFRPGEDTESRLHLRDVPRRTDTSTMSCATSSPNTTVPSPAAMARPGPAAAMAKSECFRGALRALNSRSRAAESAAPRSCRGA